MRTGAASAPPAPAPTQNEAIKPSAQYDHGSRDTTPARKRAVTSGAVRAAETEALGRPSSVTKRPHSARRLTSRRGDEGERSVEGEEDAVARNIASVVVEGDDTMAGAFNSTVTPTSAGSSPQVPSSSSETVASSKISDGITPGQTVAPPGGPAANESDTVGLQECPICQHQFHPSKMNLHL